ncbi:MAG: FAD-dependent monooxygenase [Hyphomicrobiales bacterium]
MTERIEIAIIGAALNGLAAALALAGQQALRPAHVMLIDGKDPRRFANSAFDGRASAITASSRRMFEALGVWGAIAPNAQPVTRIVVTDTAAGDPVRPTLLQFGDAEPQGAPSAYIVENRHLYATLFEAVEASPRITLLPNTQIASFGFGKGPARLETDDNRTILAELVIAADGRNSPAREAAGIKTTGWAYGQTGIVTAVEHDLPHEGCAEEHFRPAGPFAILPLPGNRSSLVWTETSATAQQLLALSDQDFLVELMARFGHHRGAVSLIGPRHGYPLSLFIAERFIGPRLALLGDAAHVVHPIAGLGLNLGLRDAAALAEAVARARYLGLDIGSDATLTQYSQWRRFDTNLTALATDGLNRLFSNDLPGLRQLRDTGLKLVNLMPPLKNLFMREAAGDTGHLPKLMRGEPV